MKLEFSRPVFKQYINIKFHENPSSGSRVVPCERTDMMKLIIAFRNLAKAPKNHRFVDMVIRNAVHVEGQSVYNVVKLALFMTRTICNTHVAIFGTRCTRTGGCIPSVSWSHCNWKVGVGVGVHINLVRRWVVKQIQQKLSYVQSIGLFKLDVWKYWRLLLQTVVREKHFSERLIKKRTHNSEYC